MFNAYYTRKKFFKTGEECSSIFCQLGKGFLGPSFCRKTEHIDNSPDRTVALSVTGTVPKGCIYTRPELVAFVDQKFPPPTLINPVPGEEIEDGFEGEPRPSEDRLPPLVPAR